MYVMGHYNVIQNGNIDVAHTVTRLDSAFCCRCMCWPLSSFSPSLPAALQTFVKSSDLFYKLPISEKMWSTFIDCNHHIYARPHTCINSYNGFHIYLKIDHFMIKFNLDISLKIAPVQEERFLGKMAHYLECCKVLTFCIKCSSQRP